MIFNAELVGFKTLADKALRITLDIPEIDQARVLSEISKYRDSALEVEIELSEIIGVLKKLRQDAYLAITNYAISKGVEYSIMHDQILGSKKMFPGKEYTSLKQLSANELNQLIKAIQ